MYSLSPKLYLIPTFGFYALAASKMKGGKEAADSIRIARIFPVVFAEFAGLRIKWPGFRDLHSHEFYHYIPGAHTGKIVSEMCADSERGLTLVGGILLQFYGTLHIKGIAEDYLFRQRVDVQRLIFFNYFVKLFPVVSAVDTQTFEHVGKVFGEI